MGRVQIATTMRHMLASGKAIDPTTGNVNCTQLAEFAAAEFEMEEREKTHETRNQ